MDPLLINLPELIETPRLFLQVPKAEFGRQVHEAILDGYDDYIKWLNWNPTPPSLEEVEKECRQNHAAFILRDLIRYLIIEKKSKEVVGRCAFSPDQTSWEIPIFGIGYFIRRTQRLKGYATEAVHTMTTLGFKNLGAKKIEIKCEEENTLSQRVPLKLNFSLEYIQKKAWARHDGKLGDIYTYSLLKTFQN